MVVSNYNGFYNVTFHLQVRIPSACKLVHQTRFTLLFRLTNSYPIFPFLKNFFRNTISNLFNLLSSFHLLDLQFSTISNFSNLRLAQFSLSTFKTSTRNISRSSLLFTCRLKVSVNAAFSFPSTFSHSPFLPFPRAFFSPSLSLSLAQTLTFLVSLCSRFLLLRLGQLLVAATTLLSTGSSRWQGTAKGTKMYSE